MSIYYKILGAVLAASLFVSTSVAGESEAQAVSSICTPNAFDTLECDDKRTCALETEISISAFFLDYESPTLNNPKRLRYPKKCFNQSYQHETTNFVFEINADGAPENIQLINSSNRCFDRSSRNYMKRLRFEKTERGFKCVPWTLSFTRGIAVDSSGSRY